ncbi:phytoene dehydrogenase-like protein [Rhizomicrobium palustre]|uniref:Pyridine nucleotide-disulfide oxidoreductase domain-containing protein 2 n=1 Tax=Rhizomicrobium palustre TaxID=189966 RepID=A0A846N0H0_9PROT|nr:FAD-dependent oxidoreductase [Rhizomicrobium palustre]NIK88851.1 phytoene dehydrogenase-like protein [Rhizomicrobium palustre]
MRYDACIIGAGPDGLAAAARLAGAGLKVLLVERANETGGPCATREFSPGFLVSPFADVLAAIPAPLFRDLDLAPRGALFTAAVPGPYAELQAEVIQRVYEDAARPVAGGLSFQRRMPEPPFPGEPLATMALADIAPEGVSLEAASLMPFDPAIPGSALAILAGAPGGLARGGLGSLGKALTRAAEEAGAEISLGLEVTDIRRRGGRVSAVSLADGREIGTRAVISTLDLKRTFLSLFAWNELPKSLVERVGAFRSAPGVARFLVALSHIPRRAEGLRAPILLSADGERAYHAWKSGIVPTRPPALVRVVSAIDPAMAPSGKAVATVTLGGIPHSPFDGPWTHEKRLKLEALARDMLEEALPGSAETIIASELLVPPDFENLLGLTEGDLMGGELAAAQMLGFRPFAECRGMRTPVPGLYLAGPSSALGPIATCASGWAAAAAVLADLGGAHG